MKCISCDCILSDAESTNLDLETNEYVDMCFKCLHGTENDFQEITHDPRREDNTQSAVLDSLPDF